MSVAVHQPHQSFLLFRGGPLFHIEQRVGLIQQNIPNIKRRALLAILLTWVPLLILSLIQGRAYGTQVHLPLLHDFSVHARFFLTVPLLLLAESIVGPRIADGAEHFVKSGVIVEKDYHRFDKAVERALRLRDSRLAELIILATAYAGSVTSFFGTAVHVSTWYRDQAATAISLTWAGWWFVLFCLPLLQFLILRWLWRLFLWFQFLNTVRKFDLQLFPAHPDEAGGLGFVGHTQRFFGILLFAYSIGVCGTLANDIVYDKTPLQHFAYLIALYIFFAVAIISGPLLVFTGKLLKAKRVGLAEYGALATAYTGAFHRKWILGENTDNEQLLGTADIRSLAELANGFAIVEKMKPFPMDPRSLLQLIIAGLLPTAFLLLAVMPLKDLLKLLLRALV